MEKKRLAAGIVIIAVVSLLLALLTTGVSTRVKSGISENQSKEEIIGQWVETNDTGVNIEFTDNDVFRMFDGDVATYTIDSKAKTLVINYAKAYGGQEMHMSYVIDGTTLTLTDTDTGDVHVYLKK